MKQTLTVQFKIRGNLSYLSHHETVSMFQRALVRAGVELCYTEGFNPRPRLSLPLPRSVGVWSDAELLYALVGGCVSVEGAVLQEQVLRQLPFGCEVTDIELEEGRIAYKAVWAEYKIALGDISASSEFKSGFERFCSALRCGEGLYVERRKGERGICRRIDVGDYIETAELKGAHILIRCSITPSGSVRIDELLGLLGIKREQLSGPIRRSAVGWQKN
jgi:radical SAM-linked protein